MRLNTKYILAFTLIISTLAFGQKVDLELLKGLKDITPSINSAMESISKIDFNKLTGMIGE